MKAYDFTETADFLTESVPLDELYDDVCGAICHVQDIEHVHGETEASQEIYEVLLTVADFLQTITPRKRVRSPRGNRA